MTGGGWSGSRDSGWLSLSPSFERITYLWQLDVLVFSVSNFICMFIGSKAAARQSGEACCC